MASPSLLGPGVITPRKSTRMVTNPYNMSIYDYVVPVKRKRSTDQKKIVEATAASDPQASVLPKATVGSPVQSPITIVIKKRRISTGPASACAATLHKSERQPQGDKNAESTTRMHGGKPSNIIQWMRRDGIQSSRCPKDAGSSATNMAPMKAPASSSRTSHDENENDSLDRDVQVNVDRKSNPNPVKSFSQLNIKNMRMSIPAPFCFKSQAEFTKAHFAFMKERAIDIVETTIGHTIIDYFRLYEEVTKRGGAKEVIMSKKWSHICNALGVSKTATSRGFAIRVCYCKMLLDFERLYYHGIETPMTDAERSLYGTMKRSHAKKVSFVASPSPQSRTTTSLPRGSVERPLSQGSNAVCNEEVTKLLPTQLPVVSTERKLPLSTSLSASQLLGNASSSRATIKTTSQPGARRSMRNNSAITLRQALQERGKGESVATVNAKVQAYHCLEGKGFLMDVKIDGSTDILPAVVFEECPEAEMALTKFWDLAGGSLS